MIRFHPIQVFCKGRQRVPTRASGSHQSCGRKRNAEVCLGWTGWHRTRLQIAKTQILAADPSAGLPLWQAFAGAGSTTGAGQLQSTATDRATRPSGLREQRRFYGHQTALGQLGRDQTRTEHQSAIQECSIDRSDDPSKFSAALELRKKVIFYFPLNSLQMT